METTTTLITAVNENEKLRTDCDELISVTHDLAETVEEVATQIKLLKEERKQTTGNVKEAYDYVIANKCWILQTLIGSYWRQTTNLMLDDSTPSVVERDREEMAAKMFAAQ